MKRPAKKTYRARTPEGQIKASIRHFISSCVPGCRIWAIVGGPLQQPGIADYLGLYLPPDKSQAIPLAIEVKAPGGRLSQAQKQFRAEWERYGGLYILAYGPEDVARALGIKCLF